MSNSLNIVKISQAKFGCINYISHVKLIKFATWGSATGSLFARINSDNRYVRALFQSPASSLKTGQAGAACRFVKVLNN